MTGTKAADGFTTGKNSQQYQQRHHVNDMVVDVHARYEDTSLFPPFDPLMLLNTPPAGHFIRL